jgi:hypothetical protein
LFPNFVNEEYVVNLENSCTMEEVLEVLRGFAKDKVQGWMVGL